MLLWLGVFGILWVGQLWLLSASFERGDTWTRYWRWRGFYRPGIAAVQQADDRAGGVLPAGTFHPLSTAGARRSFVLASGVYAAAATAGLSLVVRKRNKR
ncbi:MAG: hypothetical protein AAGK78_00845 [Planctomycetota bacterium]